MEPIYQKSKQKEDCLLHTAELLFDYRDNRFPQWYPIKKEMRICCHHHLHEKVEILYFVEGTVFFQIGETPYTCTRLSRTAEPSHRTVTLHATMLS